MFSARKSLFLIEIVPNNVLKRKVNLKVYGNQIHINRSKISKDYLKQNSDNDFCIN